MPRISLCLIARDEERFLPGCLAAVKGAVDEIVLIDTGSRDRTREIAASAGARVFDLPWNDDFSAPRNEAIRRARGDWLLQLDADERLAPGAGPALRRAVRKARFDVGMLPLHNASALDARTEDVLAGRARLGNPMSLPRLLRSAGRPEYRGIIHESVEEWFMESRRKAAFVDAAIVHLGAIESLRADRGKNERNLALLRRRCALVPDDVTALAYLASELCEIGDVEGATAAIEAGWSAIPAQPAWRSISRLAVNRARLALQRGDPATALESVEAAERRQGPGFDLAFMRGRAWDVASWKGPDVGARVAAASQAAAAYEQALALHARPEVEKLSRAGPIDLHLRRGHALLVALRVAEAAAEFDAVLRCEPASTPARLGRAEALLSTGDALEALRLLEPVLRSGDACPDAWLLAADAAQALGAHADGELFLTRARERLGAGFAAPHRELRCRPRPAEVAPAPRAPERTIG